MRASILLLFAFAVSGCVQTRPAMLGTPDGRAEMNVRTAGRTATLGLRGAQTRAVRNLRIGPHETTWVDRSSGRPQSAPTADVTSVSMRRGTLWRPLLTGAVVGSVVGWVASTGDQGGFLSFPPAVYIGVGALDGAVIGAGVGAVQTARYRVEPERLGVAADSLGGR